MHIKLSAGHGLYLQKKYKKVQTRSVTMTFDRGTKFQHTPKTSLTEVTLNAPLPLQRRSHKKD